MMNNTNTTQIHGTGAYTGLTWNGKAWTAPDANGQPIPVRVSVTPIASTRSNGSTIAGVLCLIVAAIALFFGWDWFQSFGELEADGNQFSGMLLLLALGAGVVAAAFGIPGIVLLNRK
jgi:hypothetical protein